MTVRKISICHLAALREQGIPVTWVTAYDYPTAHFADLAGMDMLLVGDSAAMTMLGLPSTLGIGMAEMLVFARAVARAAKRALVIGDMPFLSYQPCDEDAVRNAGAFLQAGCDAVKCEGGARIGDRVQAIVAAGIPVMGHLGLTPQNASQLGGYRVQGKTLADARQILEDALTLQAAGVFAILFEAMSAEAAAYVRDRLRIPAYGIGAGAQLDGQLLISHDLLGNFVGDVNPRFVRRYADLGTTMREAFAAYVADVRAGKFPGPEHCYPLAEEVAAEFRVERAALQGAPPASRPEQRAAASDGGGVRCNSIRSPVIPSASPVIPSAGAAGPWGR
ncbi:MAG: 3-methyl-2-oxobutanoate hydroxymethyltransferase [Gemmatimonadales bacterium]